MPDTASVCSMIKFIKRKGGQLVKV